MPLPQQAETRLKCSRGHQKPAPGSGERRPGDPRSSSWEVPGLVKSCCFHMHFVIGRTGFEDALMEHSGGLWERTRMKLRLLGSQVLEAQGKHQRGGCEGWGVLRRAGLASALYWLGGKQGVIPWCCFCHEGVRWNLTKPCTFVLLTMPGIKEFFKGTETEVHSPSAGFLTGPLWLGSHGRP